jgi:hypothetical protein
MSRGRRFDAEPKLNVKKVFAVIIAIAVIIMFVFIIKGVLTKGDDKGKISSQSYFAAYHENKWGVIDANGNFVIDPSYQEMVVVPNPKTDVFLCTYDVNYETGEYKTKAFNSKSEQLFEQYDQIEAIQNKDEANTLWYEDNVLKVQKEGKYGMINLSGKEVVAPDYDELTAVSGIKNAYLVKKDNHYGIVDGEGKVILPPTYLSITNLGKDNKSGYIVKADNEKQGIVDYSAKQVVEIKYDGIEKVYGNDYYVVTQGGKQKLIKKDGTDVLTTGFDTITAVLTSQENAIIFTKGGKYGVMKVTGEVIIPAQYEDIKPAKTGTVIAKKDGKYGVIDLTQTEKIPFTYQSITYQDKADIYVAENEQFESTIYNRDFEEKLKGMLLEFNTEKGYLKMIIGDETKYYNFQFEEKKDTEILPNNTLYLQKKDGKFGFVDKNGKTVIEHIYDDATEQNAYGYAGIKKDGKWGSIDSKGNVVQEPTYSLDEYLSVDFIGRWHLGMDMNMNYYTQE